MEILKLKAATKDYLWGGNKLREQFGKESEDEIIAESWELSAHKDGLSVIENGDYQGYTFDEYLEEKGNSVIGKNYQADRFPILIKFIDALKALSIQVHPKDDYAQKYENDNGKTEMWYILEAEEDAFLYYGFNREVTKEEYKNAIDEGTLEELLNKVYVQTGDVLFIEAGTVHAIGAGIVICEVQQNSNVTYRVYDYMRKDKDGNLRELHIDKALEVSALTPNEVHEFNPDNEISSSLVRLAKSEYFDVLKGVISDLEYTVTDESFQSLTFIEGSGVIKFDDQMLEYKKGDTFFLPAQNANYIIQGEGSFIVCRL